MPERNVNGGFGKQVLDCLVLELLLGKNGFHHAIRVIIGTLPEIR